MTDNQATLAMGSLAIAPSNSNIIYAGTGDSEGNLGGGGNLDNRFTPGQGILKSTNGGQSWVLLGQLDSMGNPLFERHEISAIVVDPTNPNIVYAAVADFVVGSLPGNTGIWKSMDGGMTWKNTTNSPTADIAPGDSFLGVVMDPTNDQVLYAAASDIGGNPNNGVYKTTDGGVHWAPAGDFPGGATDGRISLAIAPTNNQVLYAAIANTNESGSGTTFLQIVKTIDGGTNWTSLGGPGVFTNYTGQQGFYDMPLVVDPTNANVFYTAGQAGADTILRVDTSGAVPVIEDISGGTNQPHADHHALAFTSTNATHPRPLLLDGNDGGIWKLDNFTPSVTWTDLNGNLEITEFEGIAVDPTTAGIAYGGAQDNGTSKYTGGLNWASIAGGDGGFTLVNQSNHMIVYQEKIGLVLNRSTNGGSTFTNIIPLGASGGLNYDPYVMDPTNSSRLLYGTATLYETTNGGSSWDPAPIGTPGTAGLNPSATTSPPSQSPSPARIRSTSRPKARSS